MSFFTGLVTGYADRKADNLREQNQRYQDNLETYRAKALESFQTYNKTRNAQAATRRAAENFAAQHGMDYNQARSVIDVYGGSVEDAHKAMLDYGAPTILGVTEQGQELGFSQTQEEQALPDIQAREPVAQSPQQQIMEGDDGIMNNLMGFVQERASRIFNPPTQADVHNQVASEMGIAPEQLTSLMSMNYQQQDAYTPVAMQHNRLGISDMSSVDAAIIRDAMVRGGPEAAAAAARQLDAAKTARVESISDQFNMALAAAAGQDYRKTGGPGPLENLNPQGPGAFGASDTPHVQTTAPVIDSGAAIARPRTQAEYDALPKGTPYIHPQHGDQRTK